MTVTAVVISHCRKLTLMPTVQYISHCYGDFTLQKVNIAAHWIMDKMADDATLITDSRKSQEMIGPVKWLMTIEGRAKRHIRLSNTDLVGVTEDPESWLSHTFDSN